MMYPIAITMSEAFPIDSNSERNPWGFCRAVSDQRSEISFDKFDMSLSEFEPLPLPPDYRINVQSAPVYENQSNVASLESARLSPPVMQVRANTPTPIREEVREQSVQPDLLDLKSERSRCFFENFDVLCRSSCRDTILQPITSNHFFVSSSSSKLTRVTVKYNPPTQTIQKQ